MYAYIDGKLVFKSAAFVVIDAGGVGYHINISLTQNPKSETWKPKTHLRSLKVAVWLSVLLSVLCSNFPLKTCRGRLDAT